MKGVATDVIWNELGKNRFDMWRKLSKEFNVIVTPHIAGATKQAMKQTEIFVSELLHKTRTSEVNADT